LHTTTVYNNFNQSIMKSISINYDLKWRYKLLHYYQWTTCGKLINTQTGRKIKKTVNGRSVGYWIKSKFIPLSKLKKELELIPKEIYPF